MYIPLLIHNPEGRKYPKGCNRYYFLYGEIVSSEYFEICDFTCMAEMMKIDLSFLFDNIQFDKYCAVYGEWCGGNIQKGVAINGLPKMFVIFGIKVDDNWIELPLYLQDNQNNIYNILQFPIYEIDIDFNSPEVIQNKIIEITIAVEECCPVGKFFGKEGVGEEIVFTAEIDQALKFKSKGEKHSVTKVKKLNPIDTEVNYPPTLKRWDGLRVSTDVLPK